MITLSHYVFNKKLDFEANQENCTKTFLKQGSWFLPKEEKCHVTHSEIFKGCTVARGSIPCIRPSIIDNMLIVVNSSPFADKCTYNSINLYKRHPFEDSFYSTLAIRIDFACKKDDSVLLTLKHGRNFFYKAYK